MVTFESSIEGVAGGGELRCPLSYIIKIEKSLKGPFS